VPVPWNPRGDPHFRWRGGEVSRVEGFSDAVFGFALTLLVVSLEVPKSWSDLVRALRETGVFAFCFALLFVVWVNHHRFFRRYGLQDGWTLILNGLLLFVVMLYVYPLRFLATAFINGVILSREVVQIDAANMPSLFLIYSSGFLCIFLLFGLLHAHALRHARELNFSPAEQTLTRLEIWRDGLLAGVGLVSIVLSQALPLRLVGLSGYSYFLIAVVETWHGNAAGKISTVGR
jgi:uncharacterized membrane protein